MNSHRQKFLRAGGTMFAFLSFAASTFATLAAPRVSAPVVVDGRLDEADWKRARPSTEFVGALQADGSVLPAEAGTRLRVLWDERTVYFGFECDGAPGLATLKEHDALLHREEVVEVFLDLTGEGTHYVELQVSPAGVTADIRHEWSQRPTYSAAHIDEAQRRNLHSDRNWTLEGLQAAAAPRIRQGKVIGWTAELAVPTAALGPALAAERVFRANFVHYRYRLNPATGVEELQPATWQPVLFGRPHVSPMAMAPVRCVVAVPASAAQAGWREASRLLVADAHRVFAGQGTPSREACFGEAVTLLNVQPRTEANLDRAAALLTSLAANGETDEFVPAARYYLGRIEQVHRFTPDLSRAKEIFRQLMRDYPASPYAQLAGVKLCLLILYDSESAPPQRLAAGEDLAGFFTLPEAKRDYHLAMADAYVRLAHGGERLLPHLLAADDSAEMARNARADLYARIAEAAQRAGNRQLAIDYCYKFLALRTRAARVTLIEARLHELEGKP